MTTAATATERECLISDHAGIYVPKEFAEGYNPADWGITPDDAAVLLAGPDGEFYWDTWDDVLGYASHTDQNGTTWTLHQDGDLWAIPEGYDWDAE